MDDLTLKAEVNAVDLIWLATCGLNEDMTVKEVEDLMYNSLEAESLTGVEEYEEENR